MGWHRSHGDGLARPHRGGFGWLLGAGASRLLIKGILQSTEMCVEPFTDLPFTFFGDKVRLALRAHILF